MRILLVEGDLVIGESLKNALEKENNVVDWVFDAEACELAVETTKFAIILLNISLPNKSGLEVLKSLRLKKNNIPIIILTANSSLAQKIESLDFGADDYLSVPLIIEELSARIRSLVRRSKGIPTATINYGDLELNPANFSVIRGKNKITILPKEFNILKTLLENLDQVVSKSRIEEMLYSWEDNVESNTVEVYIHRLRKKLGKKLIKTIRGVGYVIRKS